VTLHLTDDKWSIAKGVVSNTKKDSWKEILSLFPQGSLSVQPHPVSNLPEQQWIQYLKENGVDATTYYYSDFPGKYEMPDTKIMFDATQYLKDYPEITQTADIELPEKFVTVQFDSNNVPHWKDNPNDLRKIPSLQVQQLLNQCKSIGYEVIFVGGESKDKRLNGPGCLKNVSYVMSKSMYHMGADSGFFHLANLVLPKKKIRIYSRKIMDWMHHTLRARSNGVKVYDIDER
jgi:hypothetical protein